MGFLVLTFVSSIKNLLKLKLFQCWTSLLILTLLLVLGLPFSSVIMLNLKVSTRTTTKNVYIKKEYSVNATDNLLVDIRQPEHLKNIFLKHTI